MAVREVWKHVHQSSFFNFRLNDPKRIARDACAEDCPMFDCEAARCRHSTGHLDFEAIPVETFKMECLTRSKSHMSDQRMARKVCGTGNRRRIS